MKTLQTFLMLLTLAWLYTGCAGSKPDANTAGNTPTSEDDYGEIEQLLGISPEDANEPASGQSDDDDLLRLLQEGNNETTGAQDNSATNNTQSNPPEQRRMNQLESEVSTLQKEVRDKDRTISNLRAQIKVMEEDDSNNSSAGSYLRLPQSGMSDAEYERTYQDAYQMAQARQFRDAITVFEQLLAANASHNLADNSQYWIGESYFALGDYRAAIVAFEKVFTHKNSNKNDYAQYKLGLCYYQLNETGDAKREFQKLIDNHPESVALINKAEQYIARM